MDRGTTWGNIPLFVPGDRQFRRPQARVPAARAIVRTHDRVPSRSRGRDGPLRLTSLSGCSGTPGDALRRSRQRARAASPVPRSNPGLDHSAPPQGADWSRENSWGYVNPAETFRLGGVVFLF